MAFQKGWRKGQAFDRVSNIRIDDRVEHFELGQIPEHATEMRAATNFWLPVSTSCACGCIWKGILAKKLRISL